MLYRLCVRQAVGVHDHLLEADDQVEADWRGRAVCDEKAWRFVNCQPAVIADKKSHPMPKVVAEAKSVRVGA